MKRHMDTIRRRGPYRLLSLHSAPPVTTTTIARATGLSPPSGASIGRLSGVGALWDCVPRVCGGGGGCAGGGVPLGAVPVLSWCGEVSLGGIQSSSSTTTANNTNAQLVYCSLRSMA